MQYRFPSSNKFTFPSIIFPSQWLEVLRDWVGIGGPDVLVLHFEDFKTSPAARSDEIRRVLRKLGLEGEEFETRAKCLGDIQVGGHHR